MKTLSVLLMMTSLYMGSAHAQGTAAARGLNFNLQSYSDAAKCKETYEAGSERYSGCIFEVAMDAQVRGLSIESRFELRKCMSEKGASFEIARGTLKNFLSMANECHETLK